MYYSTIKKYDIADGPGVRVTLFVSGCTNGCEGCFQPETWDFRYGQPYTKETQQELLQALSPAYIQGLTLLGGEPFEPENQRELVTLLRAVRAACPGKDIWCYTGFTFDRELAPGGRKHCEVTDEMLGLLDILVDGRFVLARRNLMLRFRGSENQRIIDVEKSLAQGAVVLSEWNEQPPSRQQNPAAPEN